LNKVEIGDCTLYQGDCLEILPTIGAVDSVITDPPYGIALEPQRRRTSAIQGDGRGEARSLWERFVPLVYELSAPDSAHLFFTGWSEVWSKEVLEAHYRVKSCIVWGKNMWGIGYYTRPQHEMAWYAHKGKPKTPETPDSDLWLMPKVQVPSHSCEKPVELIKRALLLCGGKVVVDPFMGSGTTGIACMALGRKFVGIELDAQHFDLACTRIAHAYSQRGLFEELDSHLPGIKQADFGI
jgi:site-specific DNA-methyltransferase (adenine-specific)